MLMSIARNLLPKDLVQCRSQSSSLILVHEGCAALCLERDHGWDGSSSLAATRTGWNSQATFQCESGDSEDSALEDQELSCHPGQLQLFEENEESKEYSKKEKKALQREIPPKVILAQADPYVAKFVQAAQKEEASWIEWEAVTPLTREQARHFLKDPQAKRRVMSARAAYRDKASGTVPSLSSGLSG